MQPRKVRRRDKSTAPSSYFPSADCPHAVRGRALSVAKVKTSKVQVPICEESMAETAGLESGPRPRLPATACAGAATAASASAAMPATRWGQACSAWRWGSARSSGALAAWGTARSSWFRTRVTYCTVSEVLSSPAKARAGIFFSEVDRSVLQTFWRASASSSRSSAGRAAHAEMFCTVAASCETRWSRRVPTSGLSSTRGLADQSRRRGLSISRMSWRSTLTVVAPASPPWPVRPSSSSVRRESGQGPALSFAQTNPTAASSGRPSSASAARGGCAAACARTAATETHDVRTAAAGPEGYNAAVASCSRPSVSAGGRRWAAAAQSPAWSRASRSQGGERGEPRLLLSNSVSSSKPSSNTYRRSSARPTVEASASFWCFSRWRKSSPSDKASAATTRACITNELGRNAPCSSASEVCSPWQSYL
mmetsp:Transcript_32184/g.92608  ORF Transcript_32184/g.92608 Transcript_32184/m.92608 type:complete len:424 (+) Transcript_32184:937-2208(+)